MKHDLASLKVALADAPAVAVSARVFRRVEFQALLKQNPPNWLFTSGRRNRFNLEGVECVYFSAEARTARLEYEFHWQGIEAAAQPATDFCAEVALQRVLDLTSTATREALSVGKEDLALNWRRAFRPTLTQLIGQAVHDTRLFSAIRYPSTVVPNPGRGSANLVIFRACVRSPDVVRILGAGATPLQEWP